MSGSQLSISTYPQVIAHIDADAFFASVEEALTPSLKGQPVVTGKERGIVACANYLAKDRGIRRGVPLFQARKICGDLVILPNDYETYGLYSQRMFAIMRNYTPLVEEYSVDEAFLDLTGTRRLHRASYEEIARRIQQQIHTELGITVSVGLSLSKSLAKLCSRFRKPNGFTAVPGRYIEVLLRRTPLASVWGFGVNTVNLLHKFGLHTAYDFVLRPEQWVQKILHGPGHDIWRELRGAQVLKVDPAAVMPKHTILKSKTFTPPSSDREFVFARLVRNAETAFMKARRHKLRPQNIGIALRHQDFHHSGLEARLNRPTSSPLEAMPLLRGLFDRIFEDRSEYRSTLVVLGALEPDTTEQLDLFENRLRIDDLRRVTQAVDRLNRRYGRHTVSSGTALFLGQKEWNPRDDQPQRRQTLRMQGENDKQRVRLPRWDVTV